MDNIFKGITNDCISVIYKEFNKKHNKQKITCIINDITNKVFDSIKPYFYSIMIVLILLFCMNCFNFYYYIKLFIKSNENNYLNLITE